MRDTSPEVQRIQDDAVRRMTPSERLDAAFEASEWLMRIAREGPTGGAPGHRTAREGERSPRESGA